MPRECASCSFSLYDQFGVYVNPASYAWALVEGGSGQLYDPVDGAAGLTSLWTWGGSAGAGSATGSYTATLAGAGGAPQYLSVTLDTATARSADATLPSFGTISNLTIVPYIGTAPQAPLVPTWTISPFDPDTGTWLSVDANGLDLTLAARAFGASSHDSQVEAIWGAGALLSGRDATGRAYSSYKLTFDYALTSHDLRGSSGGQAALSVEPPPTVAARVGDHGLQPSFAVLAVAALVVARWR
jgi:hypothetical protein